MEWYVIFLKPIVPPDYAGDPDPVLIAYMEWQIAIARGYGVAEVVVAKSRHGSTGTVPVKFDAKITRFSDLADSNYVVPDME